MSVYTTVEPAELEAWLAGFGGTAGLGHLIDFTPIAAGLQNSNYFLSTVGGRWVLTLFERLDPAEIDGYLRLMAHLAARCIPCPQPRQDRLGRLFSPLAGRPAALVDRLPGHGIEAPTIHHCHALGVALAGLHRAASDFPDAMPHPRGAVWRQQAAERLRPLLPEADRQRLDAELAFQATQDMAVLPQGVIHADLFRDNVLWHDDGRLSGILDFYFAGVDAWLFDLAVVANDWCQDDTAEAALLAGYASVRPLTPEERAAWVPQRRAAALRFWLSRLEDRYFPRPGEVVTVKDPGYFAAMLARLAGGG